MQRIASPPTSATVRIYSFHTSSRFRPANDIHLALCPFLSDWPYAFFGDRSNSIFVAFLCSCH
jgi:hypothetical protein